MDDTLLKKSVLPNKIPIENGITFQQYQLKDAVKANSNKNYDVVDLNLNSSYEHQTTTQNNFFSSRNGKDISNHSDNLTNFSSLESPNVGYFSESDKTFFRTLSRTSSSEDPGSPKSPRSGRISLKGRRMKGSQSSNSSVSSSGM